MSVFRDPFPSRGKKPPAPIIPAVDAGTCRYEVESLPERQKLLEQGDHLVRFAHARQIPQLLQEIGRLRENRSRKEVVGAYRFAGTDDVLSRLHPALELGRSFVRPEYQKSFAPLLLLWKGIGHYVARNPRYRILFGPVSISDTYSPASRALIVSFLKERHFDSSLAPSVRAKHKYPTRPLRSMVANADELSDVVAGLEPDHKGLPVLLRQYLNVGGQILDFSVDRHFSRVLDGLIVVDLAKTDARLIDKYLSKAGAGRFWEFHGIGC